MGSKKRMRKRIEREKVLQGMREARTKAIEKRTKRILVDQARQQVVLWWIRPLAVHRKVEALQTLAHAYAGVSKGRAKREAKSLARAVREGGTGWDRRDPKAHSGAVSG